MGRPKLHHARLARYADLRTGGVLRRWLGEEWFRAQPLIDRILLAVVLASGLAGMPLWDGLWRGGGGGG